MPNWCSNSVTFYNDDPAQIERLKNAYLEDRLFSEFVPNPAGPEAENWYSFNSESWGTKWDSGGRDIVDICDTSITVMFDTAWSPPLAFYRALEEQGWDVEAQFYEPGMAFVGKYEDGVEESYDIPSTIEEVQEQIPADMDECWGITENMEMWQEEEDDSTE